MNERQLKLLKLLSGNTEFLPASYYSKKLNVSTKTIYQDLSDIELILKTFSGLFLKKLPALGVKLSGSEEEKHKLISTMENNMRKDHYSPLKRRIELVKFLFLNNKELTLEQLSSQFLVSKTSIYNDIKILNSILNHENVFIHYDLSGIILSFENESDVQKSLKTLINYFIKILDTETVQKSNLALFFKSEDIDKIELSITKRFNFNLENIPDYYINSLMITLLIFSSRLRLEFHIEENDEFIFESLQFMQNFVFVSEVSDILTKEFLITLTDSDRKYLAKQLFAHKITNVIDEVQTEEFSLTIQNLLEQMSAIEKVEFTGDSHLFQSLLSHIPAMIIRIKKGITITNPLLNDIKKQYSELFSVLGYVLSSVEKKYNIILSEDEISLLLIHFQVSIDKTYKPNNIIIVCKYGTNSAQYIYNKVRKFLPAYDNVEIVKLDSLDKSLKLTHIDLIITSIELSNVQVPHVKVTPLVDEKDYIHIMESYIKYVMKKKEMDERNIADELQKNIILGKYVIPDCIFLNQNVTDKYSAISNLVDELEVLELVDPNFKDSVLRREEIGNTNLDTGVAMPHGDPQYILKSHICIMTSSKNIDWGDLGVKLIVMINICEEDISDIRKIVEEFYKFIDQKSKVEVITNMNNITDLQKLLN